MNTSYDKIWTTYLEICKTSDYNLPSEPEQIYPKIKNATLLLNNRMRTKFVCDDETETLSPSLSDDELLLLAHYIKLVFLQNELVYYQTLLQPFQKEIGLRNFTAQINTLKASVEQQKNDIEEIVRNLSEDFL